MAIRKRGVLELLALGDKLLGLPKEKESALEGSREERLQSKSGGKRGQ